MCTAQYSACLKDPRGETHTLYGIKQRQDQSQLEGLESKLLYGMEKFGGNYKVQVVIVGRIWVL